jgi:hypothetical protein
MKTALFTLALLGALLAGSTASAAVFVHAGPVTVAVGRPYYRPIARPVVRPVLAAPAIAPVAPLVWPRRVLTPAERAEIRSDVWETRRDIWNAIHN